MTGPELRAARLRLGLTQAEMAAELDLVRETIGRYERRAGRVPRYIEYAVRFLLTLR